LPLVLAIIIRTNEVIVPVEVPATLLHDLPAIQWAITAHVQRHDWKSRPTALWFNRNNRRRLKPWDAILWDNGGRPDNITVLRSWQLISLGHQSGVTMVVRRRCEHLRWRDDVLTMRRRGMLRGPMGAVADSHGLVGIYVIAKMPNIRGAEWIHAMAVAGFMDAMAKIYPFAILMYNVARYAYVEQPLNEMLIPTVDPRTQHKIFDWDNVRGS
jgi:hypothetical protein